MSNNLVWNWAKKNFNSGGFLFKYILSVIFFVCMCITIGFILGSKAGVVAGFGAFLYLAGIGFGYIQGFMDGVN